MTADDRAAPTTIPATIARAAETFGDDTAIVDGDTTLSWRGLHDEARTFAAALVEAGVAPGDRVSIWAPNSARWIVALFGLQLAGATLVPINTRFKGAEAADILGRARVRALITTTGFLDVNFLDALRDAVRESAVRESAADDRAAGDVATSAAPVPGLDALSTVVTVSGPPDAAALEWDAFLAGATDEARAEVDRRGAAVGADDHSDIIFTSGTTGRAKGVVQTQQSTLRVGRDWAEMTGLGPQDRYLMVNPYFHMFGFKAGILAATTAGTTMYPMAVLDVDEALATVERERITVLPGAPTLYQSILDHPELAGRDLSSLRVMVTGAADIPVVLIERIMEELPFDAVMTGYGLTEGGTVSATAPDDDPEAVATTVGLPRPGFEIRLLDTDGTEIPVGTGGSGDVAGEILVRGGSLMAHYLDDAEATAAAVTDDGWLRTGDLGMLDDAGRLRIVGRTKDMFIVGGFNAYPAEIENVLLGHSEVAAVAVIGIPDERMGEVGMAFVVPATDAATPADELPDALVAWARERMANYKVPRRVELVDSLPLNATGKVEKLVLRDRALSPDV